MSAVVVTRVERISYLYTVQRAVVPLLNISPQIHTVEGNKNIDKIPMVDTFVSPDSDFEVAQGDVIQVELFEDKLPKITVISKSRERRDNLRYEVCPHCGHRLVKLGNFSYCFNLDCHAQKIQSILLFTSALGLSFVGSNLRVIESLFTRSLVNNITDLFNLSVENITTEEISVFDAQMFQQYIHSVRGNTTIEQVLRGLHVPCLTNETIRQICEVMRADGYNIGDMDRLMDPVYQKKHSEINWEFWNEFTSVHKNVELISVLSKLLYF